jgi:uncharacterized membrane protein YbhN (UPF0104 family)
MSKKGIFTILKFTFAILLLIWLAQKGKLDFSLFSYWANNPIQLFMIYLLALFNFLLVSFRYKLLLEFRSKFKLKWSKIIKSNWIGTFFNAVLPGSVSGDLIKIFYVHDDYPTLSKSFLLASSFLDRIIGLMALILQLSFVSLLFSDKLPQNKTIINIININHLLSLMFIVGYFLLVIVGKKFITFFDSFSLLKKPTQLLSFIYEIRTKILILISISFVIQFIGSFIFYSLIQPFELTIGLAESLTIIPIGFVSVAIPLAPSGLGVGHMAFEQLFNFYNISGGANFFSLYFVVTLTVNLIGVIPYIIHKKVSIKNEDL